MGATKQPKQRPNNDQTNKKSCLFRVLTDRCDVEAPAKQEVPDPADKRPTASLRHGAGRRWETGRPQGCACSLDNGLAMLCFSIYERGTGAPGEGGPHGYIPIQKNIRYVYV